VDDIVKRLREVENYPDKVVRQRILEAADEIERLRLELDMTQATIRVPSQKDDVRTIERLREELVSALDEAARLRKALLGWQEWWEAPWEAKRPDVAELRYRAAKAALEGK
jgi:hypothetical protein